MSCIPKRGEDTDTGKTTAAKTANSQANTGRQNLRERMGASARAGTLNLEPKTRWRLLSVDTSER